MLADTDTLNTLPPRELAAGLAEVIKYGVIVDAEFFAWLEKRIAAAPRARRRRARVRDRAAAARSRPRSSPRTSASDGRRALLNLGHTFGHALEAIGGYERWLHGEAVAVGMVLAARISRRWAGSATRECERIEALLTNAGLPTAPPASTPTSVLERMQLDKKADQQGLKLS